MRRRALFLFSFLLAGSAPAPPLWACDTSSCSYLTRSQTGLLRRGAWRVDLSWSYIDESRKQEGGEEVENVYRPKVALERGVIYPFFHREITGDESLLRADVAYGLTSRATLLVSLPVWQRRSYEIAHAGFQQRYATVGFGDGALAIRHSLGLPGLVGGLSFKLPTGSYRLGGDFDGSILDPSLQPGTGSYDFAGYVQYAGRIAPWQVDWSTAVSYQWNTNNDLAYRFGNVMIATGGLRRDVAGPVGMSLLVKLVHEGRSEFLSQGVPSTGSDLVYVTPGLHARMPGGTSAYAFLQLLAYRWVNETQLAPRAAVLVGVSKAF